MEYTVDIEHGPLNIEISGGDREALQDEIIGLAEFVEENEEALRGFSGLNIETGNNSSQGDVQTSATKWQQPSTSSSGQESSKFAPVARQTDVNEELLAQLFTLPEGEEGVPEIHTYHFDNGTKVLGNARNQRQAQASAILLYLWDVCLGEKKIKYDRLDEALTNSDIETERRNAMGQAFNDEAKDWFESEGGQIWIIGTGKNHVRNLIDDLAEKV